MKAVCLILSLGFFGAAAAQKSNALVLKGNEAYRNGDFAKAETDYDKALLTDEKNDAASFNKGNALQKQKKYAEAGKQFDKTATSSTDKNVQSQSLYNKGVAEVKQKQLQEAVNSFKQSLRLNPNDNAARENLQKAMNELKKQQEQNKPQQNKQQKPQEQPKKPEPPKMDKKQLEDQLNRLREEEKKLQKSIQQQNTKQVSPDKDW